MAHIFSALQILEGSTILVCQRLPSIQRSACKANFEKIDLRGDFKND
jgi:hypothetical protein